MNALFCFDSQKKNTPKVYATSIARIITSEKITRRKNIVIFMVMPKFILFVIAFISCKQEEDKKIILILVIYNFPVVSFLFLAKQVGYCTNHFLPLYTPNIINATDESIKQGQSQPVELRRLLVRGCCLPRPNWQLSVRYSFHHRYAPVIPTKAESRLNGFIIVRRVFWYINALADVSAFVWIMGLAWVKIQNSKLISNDKKDNYSFSNACRKIL